MGDYALLFRGRDLGGSPEQIQQTLKTWRAWFDDLQAKGHLADPGHPLEERRTLVSGRQRVVNDGPFVETKDIVAGFILLSAADMGEAVELSKGCPILDVGGSVEVCAIAGMLS